MNPMFAMFGLGPMEMVALGLLGVVLFGKRLPEVGRFLGKGIVEFKKGLKGLEDEVETTSRSSDPAVMEAPAPRPPQRVATTAPKFEEGPPKA